MTSPITFKDGHATYSVTFELVEGRLRINIGPLTVDEETWAAIQHGADAFMAPVWDARKKAADDEYTANYRREHNIREHTETIEGVPVVFTTQGADNRVCHAYVGDAEKPHIKLSRVYGKGGHASSWNAEIYDAKISARSHNKHCMSTLRNKRGGAIAFKTPHAALLAAIRHEKLAEQL